MRRAARALRRAIADAAAREFVAAQPIGLRQQLLQTVTKPQDPPSDMDRPPATVR